jgi:lysophospholipase L1-like esterase
MKVVRTYFLLIFCLFAGFSATFAQKKKVACIGNSITEGVGLPFHRAQAYPAALQAYLENESYEVMNFGVSGHTLLRQSNAPYWGTGKYQDALDFQPDIVIIKLGTNDSGESIWTSHKNEFNSDYIDFINTFKALASEPKVYLCYPITIFPENSAQSKTLVDEVIPKIAEVAAATGSIIINLNDEFKGKKAQFYADDLHPNVMGARRIAYLIAQTIVPDFDKQEGDVNLISYVLPFDRTDPLVLSASSAPDADISPLLDNDASTALSLSFQSGMYFQLKLAEKVKITSYTLTADDSGTYPQSWNLQAFTGNNWVTIGTQNNITFQAKETKLFDIPYNSYAAVQSASEYRLVINSKNGASANPLNIAELQMFGSPSVFKDALTSNGGTITDKYNLNAHQGVQFLNDKIIDTKYCAVDKGYTYWIQYRSPEPVRITGYSLTSAEDVPDRDPSDWTLEASIDGVEWELLDKQEYQYFMSRYSTLEYPVANEKQQTPYTYFRLNISRIRNWQTFQLAEWQLFGDVTPRIKVACIGNSITEGIGVSNANDAYPAILQKNLGNGYEVRNFGASGRMMTKEPPTPEGWSYWTHPRYQASLDWEPDIVIIKLGTNDSGQSNWPAFKSHFKEDYIDMVQSYQALPGNPQVYTCFPIPISPASSVGNEKNLIEEVIPLIKEVSAEKNTTIIDLHTPLMGKSYMTPDGCHPNEKGTAYMAHMVAQALCPECELPPLPDDLFLLIGSFDHTDKRIASSSSVTGLDINPLMDNNPLTAVNIPYTPGSEVWFEVELPADTKITAYSITSDSAENSPKTWELQGISTTGDRIKINEQNEVRFLSAETQLVDDFFTSYAATGNYKKYRLLIKDNNGGNNLAIKEWQLFGCSTTIEPSITGNGGTITERLNKKDGQSANQLIDRDVNTKYCTAHLSTGTPYWIRYESSVPAKINRYALTSAEDAPGRDPVDWVLEGSQSGSNWVLLDAQNNQEFMGRYSTLEYPVTNTAEYTYFRLTVNKLKEGNMFQLSEWQLFAAEETELTNIRPLNTAVYSNKNIIFIKSGEATPLKYIIYNISGQCLDTGIVAPGDETSKSVPSGMYFIAYQTETNRDRIKLMTSY